MKKLLIFLSTFILFIVMFGFYKLERQPEARTTSRSEPTSRKTQAGPDLVLKKGQDEFLNDPAVKVKTPHNARLTRGEYRHRAIESLQAYLDSQNIIERINRGEISVEDRNYAFKVMQRLGLLHAEDIQARIDEIKSKL